MDPRERADAALARARARGSFVVTPEDAISPMDAASTVQIPRSVIAAAGRRDDDPEATMVVPVALTGPMTDDRTRSMRPPVPPQAHRPAEQAYAADNPITHQPRTQPLPRMPQPVQRHEPPPQQQQVREEQDGIIPTTTTTTRRSLTRRLDGD